MTYSGSPCRILWGLLGRASRRAELEDGQQEGAGSFQGAGPDGGQRWGKTVVAWLEVQRSMMLKDPRGV